MDERSTQELLLSVKFMEEGIPVDASPSCGESQNSFTVTFLRAGIEMCTLCCRDMQRPLDEQVLKVKKGA